MAQGIRGSYGHRTEFDENRSGQRASWLMKRRAWAAERQNAADEAYEDVERERNADELLRIRPNSDTYEHGWESPIEVQQGRNRLW